MMREGCSVIMRYLILASILMQDLQYSNKNRNRNVFCFTFLLFFLFISDSFSQQVTIAIWFNHQFQSNKYKYQLIYQNGLLIKIEPRLFNLIYRFKEQQLGAKITSMKFLVQNNQKAPGKTKTQIQPSHDRSTLNEYYFYNIMNPSNKIQCDICKKDVSKVTKILANDSDYCVGCFSNLDDTPDKYHVINRLNFPVFDSEWTAEEELLLFEGLEKHGFGNWSEIAQFIGNGKTREDVQEHYTAIYLQADDFLPLKREVLSRRDGQNRLIIKNEPRGEKKRSGKSNPKTSVSNSHQFQRGSLTIHNTSSANKTGTNPAQIVGYMPKRRDFEVQYDNDAELLLAEMEFNDDDSEEEKQMKFRLIDIYNHKLDERLKRKEFVITRGLLDLKEQMRLEKNRTKEEKEIYNMMKVFARFSSAKEHEELVKGIIREKQIRQRIEELKEFKKKGFRTLQEIQEELENKRKKEEKSKKRIDNDVYGVGFGEKGTTRRAARKDVPVEKNEKKTTFLTKEEEQLCGRFNITFKQYMLIKETLIRESIKQGILVKDESSKLFKIDRGVTDGIFDFLVEKQDIIGRDR